MKRPPIMLAFALAVLPHASSAQSMVSLLREARIGGSALFGQRTGVLEGNDVLAEASGTPVGGEFVLRGAGFGLRGRALTGSYTSATSFMVGKWTLIEGAFMVGPRFLSVEGGLSLRTVAEGDSVVQMTIPRVGGRSEWRLAAGLVQASIAGGLLFAELGSDADVKSRLGHDAEVSVLVHPFMRGPIYLQLGYRYESLHHREATGSPVEEMNGVLLVVGLRMSR